MNEHTHTPTRRQVGSTTAHNTLHFRNRRGLGVGGRGVGVGAWGSGEGGVGKEFRGKGEIGNRQKSWQQAKHIQQCLTYCRLTTQALKAEILAEGKACTAMF